MEQEIIHSITELFNAADEHDWARMQYQMADSILVDYSSFTGIPAAELSSATITEAWKNFLPGFDKTHHQLSNFSVSQQDGSATATFNGKADHFIGNESWTLLATYNASLVKKEDHWVITKLQLNLLEQSGNTGLPAIAAKIVQEKNSA